MQVVASPITGFLSSTDFGLEKAAKNYESRNLEQQQTSADTVNISDAARERMKAAALEKGETSGQQANGHTLNSEKDNYGLKMGGGQQIEANDQQQEDSRGLNSEKDNSGIRAGGGQQAEGTQEDSDSKLQKLQKQLQEAQKKLQAAQEKLATAQNKAMSAKSEEEAEAAKVEVQTANAEVQLANAQVVQLTQEIQDALSNQAK